MPTKRDSISLTGISTKLIALGGWQEKTLREVEQYLIIFDKWINLPKLNIARQSPGSCIVNTNNLFCFAGSDCG